MKERLALLAAGATLGLGGSGLVYEGLKEKQPAPPKNCSVERQMGGAVCNAAVSGADTLKLSGVLLDGMALLLGSVAFAKSAPEGEAPLPFGQPSALPEEAGSAIQE